MFRSASRTLLRGTPATQQLRFAQSRRWISDASSPVQKKQGWRSTVVRWGLAAGAVYYYNTSPIFAEEPPLEIAPGSQYKTQDTAVSQTIESLEAAKKTKSKARPAPVTSEVRTPSPEETSIGAAAETGAPISGGEQPPVPAAGDAEQEGQEGQEAAFNPETGEINWDCPCLGGMAHGPCGEDFRAAFSCFVYSQEEPKGMDCIDKFKAMQDCFRQHPDIYGNELDDDEVDAQLDEHIASEKQAEQKASSETSEAAPAAVPEPSQSESTSSKDKLQEAVSKELEAIQSKASKE
ncbi:mitochondrial intermembrane space import and assembly protein [Trichophyton mentagrophytes]|nr:mitochondrial intermembrane space import and assembly protein [Trichophyton mentagrophytes]